MLAHAVVKGLKDSDYNLVTKKIRVKKFHVAVGTQGQVT